MARRKELTRREFLATSAAATATLAVPMNVFAHSRAELKVGLIGSGGRGTGAVSDSINADASTVLWAMGDLFQDRLNSSRTHLEGQLKEKFKAKDRQFVGWDAYQKVIDSGVDIVILTAPPCFRPQHLKAAIEAGKHVFMEKPVATDAPGVRSIIETSELAARKKLCIVAGTQRRHDVAYREAMKRLHDGDMGEVVSMNCYWNQGGLWMVQRKPGMTDMEWQLRNWLYFTWIAGDHIVEQHIHNIDVCNWAIQKTPIKAISLGGRQVRTGADYGHVFDHFATEFEYDNGVKMVSMCRQIDGTASRVSEHIVGSRGYSDGNNFIKGKAIWEFEGDRPNPYVLEHRNLIEAIKGGPYINEGRQVAETTLTAIMGRMAAYTGQEITWDQALKSQQSLMPEKLEFGPLPVPQVAIPGVTKIL